MKKVGVKIMPREEVLDSQGRAILETLQRKGLELSSCRMGKYIELELNADNEEEALSQAREMTQSVLHNPLIEKFELEVL